MEWGQAHLGRGMTWHFLQRSPNLFFVVALFCLSFDFRRSRRNTAAAMNICIWVVRG